MSDQSPRSLASAPHPAQLQLDDLLGLRRLAPRLMAAPRRRVSAQRAGPSRSRALGRGLDFAEVREYQPGDDLRQMDWNVTARTGKPHTKLFVEERERPVFICVDLRPSMHFGTRGSFKSVAAGRLAALLAWCVVSAGDRVGGLVFGAEEHRELKPASGHRGVARLAQSLIELQGDGAAGEPSSGADSEAFGIAMARLRRLAHTGASIYLISDFRGFSSEAELYLNWLRMHNEFNAVYLSDPLERDLPAAGLYPLQTGDSVRLLDSGDHATRDGHRAGYLARRHRLARFFSGHGNHCSEISTGEGVDDQAERILRRLPARDAAADTERER